MRSRTVLNASFFIFFTVMALLAVGQTKQDVLSKLFKERYEIYFNFELSSPKDIQLLTNIISIDDIKGTTVYAYASQKEFSHFLDMGFSYDVLTPPSMLIIPEMKESVSVKGITEWDFYPTYQAYVSMMYQFQTDYPNLCQVVSIGQSIQGRELLFARISDNVGTEEGEPQFMYTGTIHGDETTGYILLLRLINYLLSNYGTDPRITNIVNNMDIWINPAANPDGTYAGGNNTVYGATRYNANGVDMNRNYPDPEDGPHPDGNAWQQETIAFMNFAESRHFVSSANTHGGAEVCNYPWDTWAGLHPDDQWWQYVCHEYADTTHAYAPAGYMNGWDNGITNGYAWYTISGGRQDYMNYFHQCREFTLELSDTKLLPANQLPNLWNYNYRSLLNYMEQALFGISGTVTDATTGNSVAAEVFVLNHDADSSWVYSSQSTGKYFRLIHQGTYEIVFSAPGYYPQTFNNIVVANKQLTILDVQLTPGSLIPDFYASATSIPVGSSIGFFDQTYGNPVSWQWTFEGANPSTSALQNPVNIFYPEEGTFDVTLVVSDGNNTQTITKSNYIAASVEYVMQNSTITTCSGVFYDSGGAAANYGNNQDYTMVFLPANPGAKIVCQFTSFNVEYQSNCNYDWLKIYNGQSASAPLIGTYCGTGSPGTVTADNASGALTFVFHSDNSVTASGWAANINCTGGVVAPVADFTADATTITEGESVHFSDLSANNPTAWNWIFEGGTPSVSTQQNPVVVYDLEGIYDVLLTVTNEGGTNTLIKQDYITVDHISNLDEQVVKQIIMYPNPVMDFLTIQSPVMIKNLAVVDIFGQVLIEIKPMSGLFNIDLSGFRNGVYFMQILTTNGLDTKKIEVKK